MGPMYQINIVFNLTLRQPSLYHPLYMIDSCILERRSNYYFDIVMSMGMFASSIHMSHIHCISLVDGNYINDHEDYSCKKLEIEIGNLRRYKDESLDDFFSRFMVICCINHKSIEKHYWGF